MSNIKVLNMQKNRKCGSGPGAPRKKPEDMSMRQNTTFRPDMVEWLDEMRRDGNPKAQVIDKALREYKEKLSGNSEAIRRDRACRAALKKCRAEMSKRHSAYRKREFTQSDYFSLVFLLTELEGIYETEF